MGRGLLDVQQGALNQVWASTCKNAKTGKYYNPVGVEEAGSEYAPDVNLQRKFWDFTEAKLAKVSL